jgi:hypothetical protein
MSSMSQGGLFNAGWTPPGAQQGVYAYIVFACGGVHERGLSCSPISRIIVGQLGTRGNRQN